MPALRSSNLAAADYDAQNDLLTITFKSGSVYRYEGVDQATYDGLLSAGSAGQYFAAVIKDGYPFTRLS
jgi:hypothetical protein